MTARGQVKSHERITGLQQREKDFGVCGSTGVRLHVGEPAAKKFRDSLNCEPFRNVNKLATAVVAFARQAFGIFVGENRSLRFKNRA